MVKETTRIDKCIGVLFAIVISLVCFAFATVELAVLKSLYLLFFAILAITVLPIVFLWPRSERATGSRPNGILKLNIPAMERRSVFKTSLSLSLSVLCIYFVIWLYMRGYGIGGGLISGLIVALGYCLIRVLMFSARENEYRGERSADQLPIGMPKNEHATDTYEFQILKKWRWLLYVVAIGVIARIVVMCMLYGIPSFCPNCILYWGKHNFNGSGGHSPAHSLFML